MKPEIELVKLIFLILKLIRLAKIFGLGRSTAAVFANKLRVTNIIFVFFKVVFDETYIFGHTQVRLMAWMRFGQVLWKRKPFSHDFSPFFFK
jgi:hypothetical protein